MSNDKIKKKINVIKKIQGEETSSYVTWDQDKKN
jgi:hypothetical protein